MSPWENECGFDSPDLADQNMVVYSVRSTVEQTLFFILHRIIIIDNDSNPFI